MAPAAKDAPKEKGDLLTLAADLESGGSTSVNSLVPLIAALASSSESSPVGARIYLL